MILQEVINELKNIREQATNDEEIGKGSILEAITDLIHDASGDGGEWIFDDDDHYDTFESEPDFTELVIKD